MHFSVCTSTNYFLEVLAVFGTQLLKAYLMLFTWTFSFYFISLGEIEALRAKEIEKQNSYAKLKTITSFVAIC